MTQLCGITADLATLTVESISCCAAAWSASENNVRNEQRHMKHQTRLKLASWQQMRCFNSCWVDTHLSLDSSLVNIMSVLGMSQTNRLIINKRCGTQAGHIYISFTDVSFYFKCQFQALCFKIQQRAPWKHLKRRVQCFRDGYKVNWSQK